MRELAIALGFFVVCLLELGTISKMSALQDTVSSLQEQISMIQATVCASPNDDHIETEN